MTSQVQLILSRDLAREVIKKLKLGELPEFDPVLRGARCCARLLSLFGIIKDPMSMTPEERVLKSYYERLEVFQVEKSRVIAIEFESQDAELAARVANAIAESYLVLQQTAKQDQTRVPPGVWLSGEIDQLAQARSPKRRRRSRSIAPRPTCSSAPTTRRCRTSSSAISTRSLASARAQKVGRGSRRHE